MLNSKINNVVPGFPSSIGGVFVDNPVWLAPLAGVTFGSLRHFYRRLGAGLVHTEMVSALGLCYNGIKTKQLLNGYEEERPVVLQLFGSKSDDIIKGAEIALNMRSFEALEINMACPMPKVTKKGSGAKLLENPAEAARMVKALDKTGLPVWTKIRIISPPDGMSTLNFCEDLFEAGADFIFVHGRTAAQRYEGEASHEAVGEVAACFPGRIGGSGDCYEPSDLIDYIYRGCAAVLAGRGIMKDVFLIPKTLKAMGADVQKEFYDPDADLQSELLLELGRSIYNTEGQLMALMIARRMLASTFRGFSGAAQLRRLGALAKTWQDMEELLKNREDIFRSAGQGKEDYKGCDAGSCP